MPPYHVLDTSAVVVKHTLWLWQVMVRFRAGRPLTAGVCGSLAWKHSAVKKAQREVQRVSQNLAVALRCSTDGIDY